MVVAERPRLACRRGADSTGMVDALKSQLSHMARYACAALLLLTVLSSSLLPRTVLPSFFVVCCAVGPCPSAHPPTWQHGNMARALVPSCKLPPHLHHEPDRDPTCNTHLTLERQRARGGGLMRRARLCTSLRVSWRVQRSHAVYLQPRLSQAGV